MATFMQTTTTCSASPRPPLENREPTLYQKLDLRTIFKSMESWVCQVSTIRGRCSGILSGQRTVIVPFHALGVQELEKLPGGGTKYFIFPIEISYRETNYTAVWKPDQKIDNAHYYDLCLFEIIDDDFTPLENLKLYHSPPAPGDKIYFAGFPLTQTNISFHKGTVSSVENTKEASYFMIDGTVLPGNSGGAVFIQVGNSLQLIGMIFAELANIDPNFAQQKQLIKQKLEMATVSINGLELNKVLATTIDTVFANLATGIGKVISIKHVLDLSLAELPKLPSPFIFNGLPVVKGEQLPGQLATDSQYADWYHRRVKGKTLCATILGRILYSSDLINKDEEKNLLRPYYEKNVLNHASRGFQNQQRTVQEKYLTLKEKIASAKPKAISQHKETWKTLLTQYMQELPTLQDEITQLITSLSAS